jgi:hypothetical protein
MLIEKKEEKIKTLQQNKTFWALLDCFWHSGCSSFLDYIDLTMYYYRVAGLAKVIKKDILQKETKQMLHKAIKILPIEENERAKIYKLLKGEYEKCLSWSVVKKEKAILAIDTLLHDMDESNVLGSKMGKKYQEILNGMDENQDYIKKTGLIK